MRLHNERTQDFLRRLRRSTLAAAILAASPAIADGPRGTIVVSPQAVPVSVRTNPFCTDEAAGDPEIQLASNNNSPAIRLKAVGTAVGLRQINEAGLSDNGGGDSQPLSIEPIRPIVRTNPLIGSTHREDNQLIEAAVVDHSRGPIQHTETPGTQSTRRSTIVIRPRQSGQSTAQDQPIPTRIHRVPIAVVPSPPKTQHAEVESNAHASEMSRVERTPNPQPPTHEELSVQQVEPMVSNHSLVPVIGQPEIVPTTSNLKPIEEVVSAETTTDDRAPSAVESVSSATAQPVDQALPDAAEAAEPVFFTISDRVEDPAIETATEDAADTVGQSVVEEAAEEIACEEPNPSIIESASDLEPFDTEQQDAQVALPIENHSIVQRVDRPSETREDTLHTKRYRPPVAITTVPIAIEREQDEEHPDPVVHAVDAIKLDFANTTTASKLVPLYMKRTQVRSLSIGGDLRQVKVVDDRVCKAVADGPNQLKIIGTGNGVTRLVVWAAPDESSSNTRSRTFEIHVSEAAKATGESLANRVAILNRTIQETFPASNVMIRQYGNQLVVAGQCESTSSAKKIMRMVRKTCLVPTQDELVVR